MAKIYKHCASLAIVLSIGFSLWRYSSTNYNDSQSYYIAYVYGQRLSDDEARVQVEAEKKSADEFINNMTELEARNKEMSNNFFNP